MFYNLEENVFCIPQIIMLTIMQLCVCNSFFLNVIALGLKKEFGLFIFYCLIVPLMMLDSIFFLSFLCVVVCFYGSSIARNIMGKGIDDMISLVLGPITTYFVPREKCSFFINGAFSLFFKSLILISVDLFLCYSSSSEIEIALFKMPPSQNFHLEHIYLLSLFAF